MVKYNDQPLEKREYYQKMLKRIGSLTRLFSENNIPYYDYRIAENLYCKAFGAKNVGRDCTSVDAIDGNLGIGIKTFAGLSAQKVAEFNKALLEFSNLSGLDKAKKIADLRNKRIIFTKDNYGLNEIIYHCVRREDGKMLISETNMDLIDLNNIELIEDGKKTLKFIDGKNEYIFNISKSVLLKNFIKENILIELPIQIYSDPFKLFENLSDLNTVSIYDICDYIILPLYTKDKTHYIVPEKSGLNQWNADGRKRNMDEVYIKIPSWIHKKYPAFFSNDKFNLHLPNRDIISAKVCQAGRKALMSDPNKALGEWILRRVLKVPYGKLLSYKNLQEIGIDSVIIKKQNNMEYSIDFVGEGEYEKFKALSLAR
jgi:hypothetical protein